MASVRMSRKALDYGSELNVATLYILEKSIEFERMVPVEIIDYCKRIPFHPIAVEQFYTLHHFCK